jgi:hypothetical protein
MTLIIASAKDLPGWEKDDIPFHQALTRLNIPYTIKPWDEDEFLHSDTQIVLIRTTWDYQERPEQFLKWAQTTGTQVALLNDAHIIEWNSKKTYLRDLNDSGAPLAPTVWLQKGDDVSLSQVLEKNNWTKGFIKPVFGASARGTCRFGEGLDALFKAQAFLNEWLSKEDMMIQPYLQSVETEGETSLLYLGGQFSHAVQKIPVPGDYRVQDDYGAKDFPIEPTPELLQLGSQILQSAQDCLQKRFGSPSFFNYARVDLMKDDSGQFVVAELELIEPSLFFRHSAQAGMQLAQHIKSLIK